MPQSTCAASPHSQRFDIYSSPPLPLQNELVDGLEFMSTLGMISGMTREEKVGWISRGMYHNNGNRKTWKTSISTSLWYPPNHRQPVPLNIDPFTLCTDSFIEITFLTLPVARDSHVGSANVLTTRRGTLGGIPVRLLRRGR